MRFLLRIWSQEAEVDEQTGAGAAEAVGAADLVLQEARLDRLRRPREVGRNAAAHREGEVARDARVVPDAPVDRERLVEIRQLFGAEAPPVLTRVAVVLGAGQVADA